MVTIMRGRIMSGKIELISPVDLPDGAEVDVQIHSIDVPSENDILPLEGQSFFGIWKDR